MSNGGKIIAGLRDALAHAGGEPSGVKETIVRVPADIDVRKVRAKLNMSQEEFARRFGVSVGTLRGWEQKRRSPEGPARVLLTIIDRQPDAVKKALEAA